MNPKLRILIFTLIIGVATLSGKNVATQSIDSMINNARRLFFVRPDSAHKQILHIIDLAKSSKDNVLIGNSYRLLGGYLSDVKNDLGAAGESFDSAESFYLKSKSDMAVTGLGGLAQSRGALLQKQGLYLEALTKYFEAIKLLEHSDNRYILSLVYNNMSTLYSYLDDNPKAEKYAKECLKISIETGNEHIESVASVTLASALIGQEKLDEAFEYVQRSLEIAEKRGDLYMKSLGHLNLAAYFMGKENFDKATYEYETASLYADSLGNPFNKNIALSNLSELFTRIGKFHEAERAGLESLQLSRETGSTDIEYRILRILSQVRAKYGDYSRAYDYLERSYLLKDTVRDQSNRQNINYMEYTFQTEKKEQQIASLEQEKGLYRLLGFAGGIIVLLLIAFLIVRQRLTNQRLTRLENEKQLVAMQAVLDGETAERIRLARDLHDGLGGMLSVVKLNLSDMKKGATIESGDVERFNYALITLDESIRELRRVAHNMMPDSLSRYGLKASLTDFCNSIPIVQFQYFGSGDRLDPKLEVMIYRTVHELVNNALKHADARKIIVQIVQEVDRIALTVQDDGSGFDPTAETTGTGLNNIRNRVGSYNGRMEIWSKPGEGTEISVDFKLPDTN